MVIFNKKAKSDDKTKKSLEIIKKEKTRIKDSKKKLKLEKKKIKQERYRKFFSTKLGKIIKKALFLNEKEEKPSLWIFRSNNMLIDIICFIRWKKLL